MARLDTNLPGSLAPVGSLEGSPALAEGGAERQGGADEQRQPDPPPGHGGFPKAAIEGDRTPGANKRSTDDPAGSLQAAIAAFRSGLVPVLAFSMAINVLMMVVPIYLFQLSDRVLLSRSLDTLWMLSIITVGLLTVMVLLDSARRFMLTRLGTLVETQLGGPVLAAALASGDASASRDVQGLRDLQQIRNFVSGPVMLVVLDAPMAPLYFAAVFLIHWHLGVVALVAGALLMGVAVLNERATARAFAASSTHAIKASMQASAQARNAQSVVAMGMMADSIRLWGRDNAESLKAQSMASDRNVHLTSLSRFLRLLTQVVILGWGAYLALKGELTGGMMIAASLIASRALAPVEGAIEGWRNLVQTNAAFARVRALLLGAAREQERLLLPKPAGDLVLERLLYVPPGTKKPVVNGVSLQLKAGDSLAIVGPSGSGKSTLAKMIVGCIRPTAGAVRLDLMDLKNWDRRQLGENLGYLPQDVELFPGSIKQNIARMRLDAKDEAIARAAQIAGVHEMIAQFPEGYETEIAVDGSPLSGGQKQQIGLARAFFGDPRVVVLDEPNANLDANGEAALDRALRRAGELGITVVVVTQRPAVLRAVNNILVMRNGQVAAYGARDQILPRLASGSPGEAHLDTRHLMPRAAPLTT